MENKFLSSLDEYQMAKLAIDGCKFNVMVCCWPHRDELCAKCGWNPKVERRRKYKNRERMKANVR